MPYYLRRISHPSVCTSCRFGAIAQVAFRPAGPSGEPQPTQIRVEPRVVCSRLDCDYHEKGSAFPSGVEIVGMQLIRVNAVQEGNE